MPEDPTPKRDMMDVFRSDDAMRVFGVERPDAAPERITMWRTRVSYGDGWSRWERGGGPLSPPAEVEFCDFVAVPEGYLVVPETPTAAMRWALNRAGAKLPLKVWRAVIAAWREESGG
jgi:hypothetical protein